MCGGYVGEQYSKVEKAVKDEARRFEREIIRPYAREFERIPVVGDLVEGLRGTRKAQESAKASQKKLQGIQRRELIAERARMAARQRLTRSEAAKLKRQTMAESMTGLEVGITDALTIVPTNRSVNSIPSLEGQDELGNVIPEV